MNNVSLYNLTEAMLAIMESDEATDEQIEAAFGAITSKDNRICHLRADLIGDIAKFKAEEQRLAAIRKAMESKVDRLQEYIKQSMTRLGIDEITTGTFKITLSNSIGSVEVTDEERIPACFKVTQTLVTVRKTEIREAIKSGIDVPGAVIVPGKTLRIR